MGVSLTPNPARHPRRFGFVLFNAICLVLFGAWLGWRAGTVDAGIAGLPNFVEGGPANPLGARGIYLFQGNKDTLFRIHGTNQPEYIGESISSGCIRMTNEDVIDLYNRVKIGTIVVVLDRKAGDSPINPRVALQGPSASTF